MTTHDCVRNQCTNLGTDHNACHICEDSQNNNWIWNFWFSSVVGIYWVNVNLLLWRLTKILLVSAAWAENTQLK